jgi:hypothetical protein
VRKPGLSLFSKLQIGFTSGDRKAPKFPSEMLLFFDKTASKRCVSGKLALVPILPSSGKEAF